MEFFEPFGHRALADKLWAAAAAERLPHALLIEGDEGIGKFVMMKWLAAGLFCKDGPGVPCGSCGPCKRVASGGQQGNHGDLLTIDPVSEGEERIRVARIALRSDATGKESSLCLESFLDLTSVEGGRRVVLIRECQRMTVSAQNALLKTLEEPRPGTLIVMETHRPLGLLTTIRSRCISVRLEPLAREQCAEVLAARGLDAGQAALLARMASGSPGRALAWHRQGALALRGLLLECLQRRLPPLTVAPALWELEGEFEGDKPTALARSRARFVLQMALELLRDHRRAEQGLGLDALPHGDIVELERLGFDPLAVARVREGILTCRADVDRNLSPEGVLERAMLQLSQAAHSRRTQPAARI